MSSELLLDAAGRRRSPAAMPGHNAGHAPRNKGRVYPADPPTVDEIVAVMRQTPPDTHGLRLRALIVVLWRGGLRIQEALSLIESDLDPRRGSILIRRGKGNRRREVGMDGWAWSDHLAPWLAVRVALPVGALFCVIDGPTRGRPWSATAARGELRRHAAAAGVRRRLAPHQLRHAHAVELAREGVPLSELRRVSAGRGASYYLIRRRADLRRQRLGASARRCRAHGRPRARDRRERLKRAAAARPRAGRGRAGAAEPLLRPLRPERAAAAVRTSFHPPGSSRRVSALATQRSRQSSPIVAAARFW
jgi:integrase